MRPVELAPVERLTEDLDEVMVSPAQAERIEAILGVALHNFRRLSTHPHLSPDLVDVVQAVITETEKGLGTVRTIVRGEIIA